MTEPIRPEQRAAPLELPPEPDLEPESERVGGWSRGAKAGTALLVTVFVAIGLFAAWTVTPGPDEEALARPDDSDVVLAGAAPFSWDPAAIADGASAQLLGQLYEGLARLDASSQVQPALAESWRVEDGGRRIVFELRDELTFSDGTPLTAEDARRSWLRVLDPAAPSPLASLLDGVIGADAYAHGEGSAQDVGLHADGDTLTVEFARPAAYFPAVAAAPTLAVVPPSIGEQAGGPGRDGDFSASGAFVATSAADGQIRLRRNPAYWAGPPPLEHITVVTDDGGRSQVDIFEDEAVDWTRIAASDASWIRYDRYLGPQLRHTDEMAVDLLGFDTTRPPFDDPAARRAVAMAVDWRRLAELDDGRDATPSSVVPPGATGRGDGDYLLHYDPNAARAELSAAGYPEAAGLPPITLVTYGVGPAAAIAEDLRRELGMEVRVEERSFEDHADLLAEDTPSMWTLAWGADYPHAHDFLGLLLRSDSTANAGGWSDATFDAIVDAAAATSDLAEQERLYGEAQAIVRDSAPLIPLDYGSSWWLSRNGLAGADISGTGQLRFADLAWVDR